MLSSVTIVRSIIAIDCLLCSNQHGVRHFVAKFGEKGLTDISQILWRYGRNMGLSYAKDVVSICSADWALCKNVTDRQTDKPRNGNIDCNRRNPLPVMLPKTIFCIEIYERLWCERLVGWQSCRIHCVMAINMHGGAIPNIGKQFRCTARWRLWHVVLLN